MYGVRLGRFYAGESMFFTESGASKACVVALAEKLKEEGVEWFDCQQLTPLLQSFGAEEVRRDEFVKLLSEL